MLGRVAPTRALGIGLAILLIPAAALAARITVPDDYPTLQAAVDASVADTIVVRAGVVTDTLIGSDLCCHIIGEGDSLTRPSIGPAWLNSRGATFVNFRFTGPIETYAKATFAFRDCRFDAGLTSIIDGDPRSMHFERCRFTGVLKAISDIGVTIDSCWFDHGTIEFREDGHLQVYNTTFTGSAALAAIWVSGDIEADVRHNTIRDYGLGIVMGGSGVRHVQGNVVERCGTGISVSDNVQVLDNVVTGSGTDGIAVYQYDGGAHVERNVVTRSGRHGLSIVNQYGPITIRNNTSAANAGSGFVVTLPAEKGPGVVSHNIAYDNRHYGLLSLGPADPELSCNDWFANDSGAVAGMTASTTDLAVDPRFCDVDGDSVTLVAGSPLANAPGCGLVGARGIGCDDTAVLVERFEAESLPDRVVLRWRFGALDPPDEHWVERSERDGAWAALGAGVAAGGTYVLEDRDVTPGRAHRYRLAWRDGELTAYGEPLLAGPAATPLAFRLAPVIPNPTRGVVSIRWSQPREQWVDLRVYDLGGREVATIARGLYPAGEHAKEWNGGRAPSGLYFLRAPRERVSRSILVIR
jgi:hypothetical protein